jgi:hypothetical protein
MPNASFINKKKSMNVIISSHHSLLLCNLALRADKKMPPSALAEVGQVTKITGQNFSNLENLGVKLIDYQDRHFLCLSLLEGSCSGTCSLLCPSDKQLTKTEFTNL